MEENEQGPSKDAPTKPTQQPIPVISGSMIGRALQGGGEMRGYPLPTDYCKQASFTLTIRMLENVFENYNPHNEEEKVGHEALKTAANYLQKLVDEKKLPFPFPGKMMDLVSDLSYKIHKIQRSNENIFKGMKSKRPPSEITTLVFDILRDSTTLPKLKEG
ncbi:MAG: hypothetical protein HQK94_19375, partial [Nitrospirae bacterium]|nr:hypothetical protein [Nitrospirota bacterium]